MAEHNPDEYKNVKFYAEHTKAKQSGFSKFKVEKEFYFCRYIDGDIAMLSQAYTSEAGRDNGIESVKKNETQAKRYRFLNHGANAYGFSLKAGNGQEIAISPNYNTQARAEHVSSRLSGTTRVKQSTPRKAAPKKAAPKKVVSKPSTRSSEQNYMPLPFYRSATKGKKTGFESFKGKDGEYYFTYFENNKIALISEGYPTAAIRDKGLASVEKNMKTESRYVYGKWDDGKEGFALRAGNNKEIARSVGYGSAAAASAGAAYLLGKRRRVTPKPTKPATTRMTTTRVAPAKPRVVKPKPIKKAAPAKPKAVKKTVAAKPKPVKKKVKRSIAPLAAGSVAAAGLAASAAKAKANAVKKAAVPVKAAPKPKPKPKPVKAKIKRTITPLAAGSVAVAGLGASAAAAKASAVKKAAVPVKAAPIKAAPIKAAPVKAAPIKSAPIAAAALGTAAVAGAAAMAAKPKAKPIAAAPVAAAAPTPAAAPVAAASAAPVAAAIPAAASTGGGGIWGWLKWVLMGLIALIAILFLFKSCVGGEKAVKAAPVTKTIETAAPAAMVTCWNGSKAKNDQACPTKITCWDDSFAVRQSACPTKPAAVKEYKCWDGSMALTEASCPTKPVAKLTASPITPASVAGRVCAPSSNVLFNVTGARPKSVSVLGTNPQFGESLSLTPDGFYRKLATAYRTNPSDKAFLNLVARSLGYGSFRDMDASMFSNDTLANGTSGLLGFGSQHALQYSSLNVTDATNLEAFKVRSANGTDVHFMKRCGNFMYVCQP